LNGKKEASTTTEHSTECEDRAMIFFWIQLTSSSSYIANTLPRTFITTAQTVAHQTVIYTTGLQVTKR